MGPYGAGDVSGTATDQALVAAVLRDLSAAADRWESLVSEAEQTTYSVDLGDIRATANADGRLIELSLHRGVVVEYTHDELTERLNGVFTALRQEAQADNAIRYGTELR